MQRSALLPTILICGTVVFAQAPQNLVINGDFANGLQEWSVPQDATCSPSLVDVTVNGYKRALRLDLRPEPGGEPWAINLRQPVDGSMQEGDRLQMRVWMRSPEACKVTAYVEVNRDPYTKSIDETVTLNPEWEEYEFAGACLQDFSTGEAGLGFHLGFGAGTVELTGIRLFDLDLKPGAAGGRPTVEHPVSMIENGEFAGSLEGNWYAIGGDRLKVDVIEADVAGYKRAMRLVCDPAEGEPPWNLQFGQACGTDVRRGDAIYFRAWLRSPDACRVSFIYELAAPPNTKSIEQMVRLTPEWKEYRFVGRASQGFRPGESQAKLFLGYDKGVVELAGVRVEDYGLAPDNAFDQTIDYWAGRPHPDTWRQPALDRIERIRKGDLSVKVLDAGGKPVPGAVVRVTQKRHDFRFGTALPARRLVDTLNPDNLRFQQEVARLFNTVTFENDLKWAAMSETGLQTVDEAIEWLRAHDIDARGHCLLWGSYQHIPPPFNALRGEELLDACRDHVTDYVTRMRGKLYLWDVVNEAGSNVQVWDDIGWEAFPDAFRWARAADPNVLLSYNDYGIVNENPTYRKQVADRIHYLLDHDAPLDVLGIQAHMSLPLTPMDRVLEILDEWAHFGKDLEITEFDVGLPDDRMHAEYVRDFMIAVFSHPSVKAFIQWGFWEGSHWRARSGAAMFRRDWTKRPAEEAYEDLVFNQWWTKWDGKTDAEGSATLRAFYGTHQVTAELNGKSAKATVKLIPGEKATVGLKLE
jgi:endo-1,4-beta-xylanase